MSPKSNSPDFQTEPLFDVSQSVTFDHTDPTAQPQYHYSFTAPAILEPSPFVEPAIEIAQPGVSIDVAERARILQEFLLPVIAGAAQRQALSAAMHTDRAAKIREQYGSNTNKRVRRAAENASDMDRTSWNLLYHALGYEATAAAGVGDPTAGKRLASDDLNNFREQYGRGKSKDRKAFVNVLKKQR